MSFEIDSMVFTKLSTLPPLLNHTRKIIKKKKKIELLTISSVFGNGVSKCVFDEN